VDAELNLSIVSIKLLNISIITCMVNPSVMVPTMPNAISHKSNESTYLESFHIELSVSFGRTDVLSVFLFTRSCYLAKYGVNFCIFSSSRSSRPDISICSVAIFFRCRKNTRLLHPCASSDKTMYLCIIIAVGNPNASHHPNK
jgi:hypothetical protein